MVIKKTVEVYARDPVQFPALSLRNKKKNNLKKMSYIFLKNFAPKNFLYWNEI